MVTKGAETPSSKQSTLGLLAAVASLGTTFFLLESFSSLLLGSIFVATAPILLAAIAAVTEIKGLHLEFGSRLISHKKIKKHKKKRKVK